MNDNRYKECLNKIDKYYKSNPDITTNELEKTIYNIEYNVLTKNSSIGPKKILDIAGKITKYFLLKNLML